jgi:hypothetical protein
MPTDTLNLFNSFVEKLAEKTYNLGSDTLTVALCAAANAPSASADLVLSDITEISYTYCSSRTVSITSSAQTSGTYKLVLADLTLTASGGSVGPFRYVVLYDNTATSDDLIGWVDYGADITLADTEYIDLNFDGAAGVLTIGP